MSKRYLPFFLAFIALYLYLLFVAKPANKQTPTTNQPTNITEVEISTEKPSYSLGQIVILKIKNNTDAAIQLPSDYPEEPFDILYNNTAVHFQTSYKDTNDYLLPPKKSLRFSYGPWGYQLFNQSGNYKISLKAPLKTGAKEFSTTFLVKPRGQLGYFWNNLFYRPIYNVLIFFTKALPGHSLGWSIILLTILIRLILLIPSQRAMESQKNMQKIQPRLKEIQEKYKGNQKKIAEETMALWKKHKVNPMGSCLPLIIQFPVLIALYYVAREGLEVGNLHLLYAPLQNFNIELINPLFLGILDLSRVNHLVLPIIIGVLQFLQMKLTFVLKKTEPVAEKKIADKNSLTDSLGQTNKIMTYFMPVMIAFFTASLPAGVGLYWGVSTLFGIGQQWVVNKEKKNLEIRG